MKKRRDAWVRVLLLLALFAAGAVPLAAQRGTGMQRGAPQDRAELERRVRERFGQMIRQRLGLDEAQTARLEETVAGFHADRSALMREQQQLRQRVNTLLEGSENADEARALLARMHELRLEEVQLWRAEEERLLEVLTPLQVLRFQALREQMGRQIQRLRGGGPPGPPGPPGGEFFPER